MTKVRHITEARKTRPEQPRHAPPDARQLLAILRPLALAHPITGNWASALYWSRFGLPALSGRLAPDPDAAGEAASGYLFGRRAGELLATVPGEVLRGLIAGFEEAAHLQLEGRAHG